MAHDVLISYSSKDKKIADAICNKLETNKIKVWMAPRDIIPGKSYAAEINRAIKSTKCVVLLFNNNSFSSQWVRKEIERAVGNGKIILPLLLEKIELDDEWDLYISSAHWLDAMNDEIEKSLNNLLESIKKILGINGEEQIIAKQEAETKTIAQDLLVEEKRKERPKTSEETVLQNTEQEQKNRQETLTLRKFEQKNKARKKVRRYIYFSIGVLSLVFFLWGVNRFQGKNRIDYSKRSKQQENQINANIAPPDTLRFEQNDNFTNKEGQKEKSSRQEQFSQNINTIVPDNKFEKKVIEQHDNLIKYSDETIIDNNTNLMWMVKDFRTIEKRFLKNASWDEAMLWAEKINQQNYAGYSDWKVPSIKEYRSINKNSNDRRIYSLLFEDQGAYAFWSRNEISSEVKSYMCFDDGFATSGEKEGHRNGPTNEMSKFSVRLVRNND